MKKTKKKPILKRYPRHVVLKHAKDWAKDPKNAESLMSVDEGPYIVTKPEKPGVEKHEERENPYLRACSDGMRQYIGEAY